MKFLRKLMDKTRPTFEKGGRLGIFHSVYEGMESFLFTSKQTSGPGMVHIHDAMDSKRTMILVIIALMPCFLFGMYNTGYQHWLACGMTEFPFFSLMWYGFLAVMPLVLTTYITGLAIEFASAQIKGEEIQEGFLVSGLLIPMILPVSTPLWMVAVATAFAVIFAKEAFGGTGYNIFNVALVTRAFLFFAYPASMSGDKAFVPVNQALSYGPTAVDGYTCATPLGQIASSDSAIDIIGAGGEPVSRWDAFIGLIPGSFGETSVLCILLGGIFLLLMRIIDWRIVLSVALGAFVTAVITNHFANPTYPNSYLTPLDQFLFGGLAFAAVFMATDPVTAARTRRGKWIYGFMIGTVAILIRTYNNGYPEGAMLAVLLMNAFAPLIDWCVVQANIRRRLRRGSRVSNQI